MSISGTYDTPLFKKLGIKRGSRLYVKNPPKNDEHWIAQKMIGVKILKRISNELDIIHFFTKSRSELALNLKGLKSRIKQNGMIWISWPKKLSGVATDLTEDIIRNHILALDLVDVKVCSVDKIWTGLKVVIRKKNRN